MCVCIKAAEGIDVEALNRAASEAAAAMEELLRRRRCRAEQGNLMGSTSATAVGSERKSVTCAPQLSWS